MTSDEARELIPEALDDALDAAQARAFEAALAADPELRAEVAGAYRSFLEVRQVVSDMSTATSISIGLVLVSGMAIGTLFTLFVIPSLYVLIAKDHSKEVAKEHEVDEFIERCRIAPGTLDLTTPQQTHDLREVAEEAPSGSAAE